MSIKRQGIDGMVASRQAEVLAKAHISIRVLGVGGINAP